MRRWNTLLLLTLCPLLGCSDSDLPEAHILENFRVLALVADPPEVNPGEEIVITPFLSDSRGEGREIRFSAEACLDPGVGFGAPPTCEGSESSVEIATNAPVTGLAPPAYTGLVTSTVTVTAPPAEEIFVQRNERDQFNGVGYLVTFTFQFPDGSTSQAFTRPRVSSKEPKNQNPGYEADPILADGAPLTSVPTEETELSVDLLPDTAETYEEIRDDGVMQTKTEAIETNWYIAEGELSLVITDEEDPTLYRPRKESEEAAPTPIFVIVTRDGRGGVAAFVFPALP